MNQLDDPGRYEELFKCIRGKRVLELMYREVYAKYAACLARCPGDGAVVEIGSGAGFAREVVPELVTSDILQYPNIDLLLDARRLPFGSGTLRAILMYNVFHHIPDVGAFLGEAERALRPGGRIFILDEHPGYISVPVLRYLHHEPYDPHAGWTFQSTGPLSGANGALSWIVFRRDRAEFMRRYPHLDIVRYEPHTPLRYWLGGGLRNWSLLPAGWFRAATAVDRWLSRVVPNSGSFVDIEIVRRTDGVSLH
jgi:SAM-dependent methyltransferase